MLNFAFSASCMSFLLEWVVKSLKLSVLLKIIIFQGELNLKWHWRFCWVKNEVDFVSFRFRWHWLNLSTYLGTWCAAEFGGIMMRRTTFRSTQCLNFRPSWISRLIKPIRPRVVYSQNAFKTYWLSIAPTLNSITFSQIPFKLDQVPV